MSVIDKKLLLEELGKRVGEIVPSGETRRILAAAGEILERYNVEAFESPAEADASEGLIRLFLDAKASEGRSDKTLGRVAARAGVEGVHPHRFRRTLATSLINRGMSLQEVAAILGHSKLDTTMTYVFVDEQRVEQAYRRYA